IRTSPISAFTFTLLSVSVLLQTLKDRAGAKKVAHALQLFCLFIAFQALVGYVFDLRFQFGLAYYTQMALLTASGFALLTVGFLSLEPTAGVMPILLDSGGAGLLFRRIIPAVLG